jgi:hypothetical protein
VWAHIRTEEEQRDDREHDRADRGRDRVLAAELGVAELDHFERDALAKGQTQDEADHGLGHHHPEEQVVDQHLVTAKEAASDERERERLRRKEDDDGEIGYGESGFWKQPSCVLNGESHLKRT